jgi:hypothetical protein
VDPRTKQDIAVNEEKSVKFNIYKYIYSYSRSPRKKSVRLLVFWYKKLSENRLDPFQVNHII